MERPGPKLVSSFVALPEIVRGSRGSGLVLQWQPWSGHVVAAGNAPVARVWDASVEQCVVALRTGEESCVTSISSAWPGTAVVAMGFGNGALRVSDLRVDLRAHRSWTSAAASSFRGGDLGSSSVRAASFRLPSDSSGSTAGSLRLDGHSGWIVRVQQPRGGAGYTLVSAAVSGEVCTWDLRRVDRPCTRTTQAATSALTAFAMHDFAPLFAAGTQSQRLKLCHEDGRVLAVEQYHEGFVGQRLSPISALDFHPFGLQLAVGGTDQYLSIYSAFGRNWDPADVSELTLDPASFRYLA